MSPDEQLNILKNKRNKEKIDEVMSKEDNEIISYYLNEVSWSYISSVEWGLYLDIDTFIDSTVYALMRWAASLKIWNKNMGQKKYQEELYFLWLIVINYL